jgi:cytoskeletal protein CcmA (bactofilin family)
MGLFSSNKPKPEPEVSSFKPSSAKTEEIPIKPEPLKTATELPQDKPVLNINHSNTKRNMDSITTISAGTNIEGQMKLEGDLHIEGTVKGIVTSKGKVTIGANGKVDGDVNCQEAEVSGKIMGKINVNDMLVLKGNALIEGDINTGKLVMESGVRFNGKCNMGAKNAGTPMSPTNGAPQAIQSNGTPAAAKVNA